MTSPDDKVGENTAAGSDFAESAPAGRSWLATLLNPKIALPVLVIASLISAPFLYRASRVAGIPDIGPPFDLEKEGFVKLAPEENAAADYTAAGALYVEAGDFDKESFEAVLREGWDRSSDGIRELVHANEDSIEQWLKATEKPDLLLHQPRDVNFESPLDEIVALRLVSRVAHMEAARLESAGNVDEAWRLHHAAFRASRHAGRHGGFIERLVGVAVHASSAQGIERWSRHPNLTSDELRNAMMTLEREFEVSAPYSTALKVEYFSLLNSKSRLGMTAFPRSGWLGENSIGRTPARFLSNEPLLTRRLLQQSWANMLEQIDKPPAQRPTIHRSLFGPFFETPPNTLPPGRIAAADLGEFILRSEYVANCYPSIEGGLIEVDCERARQAALIAALAIQIHRRTTGKYPTELRELVDKAILAAIPADPSGPPGAALNYRVDPDAIVIWSVGADGVDNGGYIRPLAADATYYADVGLAIPLRPQGATD